MDLYRKPDKEHNHFWLDLVIIVFVIFPLLVLVSTVAKWLGLP